jgi:protein gp37
MAEHSAIVWTDATVNFWWGCTKVSAPCDNCYAEAWSKRSGGDLWGAGAARRKVEGAIAAIRALQRKAASFFAKHNRRRRVFISSMSDIFDNEVDLAWFAEAWSLICECDQLDIQLVTKRLPMIEKLLAAIGATAWPQHVGLIITVADQAEADRDVPRLLVLKRKLGIPWVGLSIEPMLGPINLTKIELRRFGGHPTELSNQLGDYIQPLRGNFTDSATIDWVIVGGESGGRARPMHPDWARALRDQCIAAGVPFNFKQHGEWREWDNGSPEPEEIENDSEAADAIYASAIRPAFVALDGRVFSRADLPEEIPCRLIERVGKKAAGRLLDGVEHDGFPTVQIGEAH